MAVDKRIDPNEPQTVNDALMIPPRVGETVELEPGTDDPLVEITEDGGAIIGEQEEILDESFDSNLAEFIDENDLGVIASELFDHYQHDLSSRKEWEEAYKKGLDLLGFKYESKTEPFKGASGAVHPVLAEAVHRFNL